MTPKQWAAQALKAYEYEAPCLGREEDRLQVVARFFEQAIAEEREACAQVADQMERYLRDGRYPGYVDVAGVARKIRLRNSD